MPNPRKTYPNLQCPTSQLSGIPHFHEALQCTICTQFACVLCKNNG